jgi:hypothetical protein
MLKIAGWAGVITAAVWICGGAWAQSSVTYGRVTAVNLVTTESGGARAAGTVVGGGLGLLAARNQSGSTQA